MSLQNVYTFDQINKALNMTIVYKFPKFRHIKQTTTPTTQVSIVEYIEYCGYKAFHQQAEHFSNITIIQNQQNNKTYIMITKKEKD